MCVFPTVMDEGPGHRLVWGGDSGCPRPKMIVFTCSSASRIWYGVEILAPDHSSSQQGGCSCCSRTERQEEA